MTIDIRANVTCSLGELIEGSISDGYIQGGLVFISGDCTLKGLQTPAMGTVVTFSYERNGVTTQIPRELRVLSSFADPFRNTTQVALGCTLTYLRDAKPLPEDAETEDQDDKLAIRTPEELICKYPDPDYPQYPGVPGASGLPEIPGYFNASAIFQECCSRLGISGSAALTARYFVDEFNYSSGYVNVISQLLETESLVGFMTSAGLLQTRSLSAGGGTGPLLDGDNVIDIAPIGLGEIVPGKVVVRYNSLRLKPIEEGTVDPNDPDAEGDEDTATPVYDNWERVQTIGKPTQIQIYYKHPFTGQETQAEVRFIPWSETITTYGDSNSDKRFNHDTCQWEIRSTGPDLSNSVIKRETRKKRILAEANGNYCSEVLSTLQVYLLPGAVFPNNQPPPGYGANRQPQLTLEGYDRVVETFEYDENGSLIRTIVETYEPYFAFVGRLDVQYIYYGLSNDGRTTIDQLPMNASEVLIQRVITTVTNVYNTSQLSFAKNQTYVGEILPNPSLTPIGQRVKVETWTVSGLTQSGQQAIATYKKYAAFRTVETSQAAIIFLSSELVLEDVQVEVSRDRQLIGSPRRPSKQRLSAATEAEDTGVTGDSEATTNADQQGRIENAEQFEIVTSGVLSKNVLDTSLPLSPDDVYGVSGNVINGQGASFAREYGRTQLRLIYGRRYGVNLQLEPGKMPAQPFSPLYLSANNSVVQYRANGTNWAFSSDGIACSTDGLLMGVVAGSGTPWVPVAPGVTSFPPAPEPTNSGEIDPDAPIPPYSELVYVGTGVRIGLTAQVVPYSLAPVEVEATPGMRLGIFISPDTQVLAEGGCALGVAATSTLAVVQTATPGVALTTGVSSSLGALQFVQPGIRIGVRGGIDPEYEYVLALLRMNGLNLYSVFTDDSRYARSVSVIGSPYTDTSTKKYGSASGAFNLLGYSDGLLLASDPSFALGSDDFTIEAWVRNSSLSGSAYQTIASYGSTLEGSWSLYFLEGDYVGDGPYLVMQYQYLDNTNTLQTDAQLIDFSAFSASNWYHIAVVRSGSNGVIYVDGVAQTDLGTGTTTHDYSFRALTTIESNPQLVVGFVKTDPADTSYTDHLYGRMDDLRITRGVARYTANFTPPTAELPAS